MQFVPALVLALVPVQERGALEEAHPVLVAATVRLRDFPIRS